MYNFYFVKKNTKSNKITTTTKFLEFDFTFRVTLIGIVGFLVVSYISRWFYHA